MRYCNCFCYIRNTWLSNWTKVWQMLYQSGYISYVPQWFINYINNSNENDDKLKFILIKVWIDLIKCVFFLLEYRVKVTWWVTGLVCSTICLETFCSNFLVQGWRPRLSGKLSDFLSNLDNIQSWQFQVIVEGTKIKERSSRLRYINKRYNEYHSRLITMQQGSIFWVVKSKRKYWAKSG